ncbi:hypothetical protein HK405_014816 [Cladochytrium tenue]|nr:hypothetical protein HK405_014816 [Cladochytrium tenue]
MASTSEASPAHLLGLNSERLSDFDISWRDFKTVSTPAGGHHGIKAYVMIPKSVSAAPGKPLKVIVKFHGGGWTTGSAIYPPWFPLWLLEFAKEQGAAIVAPNYRLLPESNGADILQDVHDFWGWLSSTDSTGLCSFVAAKHPEIVLDLGRVIAVGESAGAHLALQSGLTVGKYSGVIGASANGSMDNESTFSGLRAVIATYPAGAHPDINGPIVTKANLFPEQKLREFMRLRPDGGLVSEAAPPSRAWLNIALWQHGVLLELSGGRDDPIWLLNRLRLVAGERPDAVPPQLLIHGEEDRLAPAENSVEYARLARELCGPERVDLVLRPGDHGFDTDITLEAKWLREKLEKIAAYWNS